MLHLDSLRFQNVPALYQRKPAVAQRLPGTLDNVIIDKQIAVWILQPILMYAVDHKTNLRLNHGTSSFPRIAREIFHIISFCMEAFALQIDFVIVYLADRHRHRAHRARPSGQAGA